MGLKLIGEDVYDFFLRQARKADGDFHDFWGNLPYDIVVWYLFW